ncbi:fos transcription factor-related [Anaeramoeba flamelloides]|uniref:Fos transcription factor-related n=1 Tax=Anaeramoeba flamelloides TaxID=1746091 RepID=A0AAV7YI26_9EUKA|nr:fos transcription factor-related [Anaeramoeba flamelloides]
MESKIPILKTENSQRKRSFEDNLPHEYLASKNENIFSFENPQNIEKGTEQDKNLTIVKEKQKETKVEEAEKEIKPQIRTRSRTRAVTIKKETQKLKSNLETQTLKKRRRRTTRRVTSKPLPSDKLDEKELERLENNRMAAREFRKREKDKINILQTKVEKLEKVNQQYRNSVSFLVERRNQMTRDLEQIQRGILSGITMGNTSLSSFFSQNQNNNNNNNINNNNQQKGGSSGKK